MNVPISWILFRTSVPDIHHYFLSSLPRKLSADFRCRQLTHRIRWIVCLCLATSQGHKRGFSLFYFQLYWIPIRLFPLNKKLLEAKPRRPERRWTAGFCLTRRVTIREIQRLSYWKASLRDCHRMLITFVLARHFRTGCDLCWEECGVFSPATAFSFERLLEASCTRKKCDFVGSFITVSSAISFKGNWTWICSL